MKAIESSILAVLAEKPSVARDIARVLGAERRGEGYLQGNGYVVTWAIGHLVSLAQPHEMNPEWRILGGRILCEVDVESLAPFPRTREAVQLHRREYYAIITYMDHQIGRVLDALEKSGKASNTYVILTADHGLAVGEHGLLGKQNVYDCSIRMPLLISGPRIPAGKRVDELVYQHSMYATTCELAGIPIPSHVEFPSLAPLLRGGSHSLHDAIFCYHREFQRTIRTKTHKLIVYPQVKKIQLFDIEKDPWEIHDLADDPAMASLKIKLMQDLRNLQKELDDPLNLHDPLNGVWTVFPASAKA